MQVQYYHPVGPHMLYHYAALPTHAATPAHPPLPPPPHHPYFGFPLIFQQHQQQRHHQQTPGSQQQQLLLFVQQQQQLAGLALHFQALSVSGAGNGSNSRNGSCSSSSSGGANSGSVGSPFDVERVRSASFSQPDYNWKLLVWLKTHRMHKYFDRLRKYNFEQLLNLNRDTLEAEQFTQGAIKKLLGMLERVHIDRAAFESPSRTVASAAATAQHGVRLPHQQLPHHQQHAQLHQQHAQQYQRPLAFPPPPPPQQHLSQPQQSVIHYQNQRFLCSQH